MWKNLTGLHRALTSNTFGMSQNFSASVLDLTNAPVALWEQNPCSQVPKPCEKHETRKVKAVKAADRQSHVAVTFRSPQTCGTVL